MFLAVVAVVGLLERARLARATSQRHGHGLFRAARARAWYYLGLYLFWAALLALPLVNNLGVAWLLVEATHWCLGAAGRLQRATHTRWRRAGSTSC